jgi:polyisoprenyl-phosphate glycosyltransferase
MSTLSLVVPCYNEQAILPSTDSQLLAELDRLVSLEKIAPDSRIVYIDDGSTDQTWALIENFAAADSRVLGIKLSRNVGHQNALLAGLLSAPGDVVVSLDADLQDDIAAIEKMIDMYSEKHVDIVYGLRGDRESDTTFKRHTAKAFYRLMRSLGADIFEDHADFRLMSRRALDALGEYREVNLFLRGIVPLIGLPSATVYYSRKERTAGESKYPLRKMMSFALDGITSLSAFPLRLITYIGIAVFMGTIILSGWTLYVALFTSRAVPGWASTALPIYFIGGVQILSIGILGEYAGKIYKEVKARPRYLIDTTTSNRWGTQDGGPR